MDIEVEVVIARVGLILADVEADIGAARDRTGHSVGVGDLFRQDPNIHGSLLEDLVSDQQILVVGETFDDLPYSLERLLIEALGCILLQAAGPEEPEVHAASRGHFHGHLDVLALAERVESRSDGTELGAEGSKKHEVIENAVHLTHGNPHVLSTRRYFDLHQRLKRQSKRQLVVDSRQPVHARNEVGDLTVVP